MIYNLYHEPVKEPGTRLAKTAMFFQRYFLPESVSKTVTQRKMCQTEDVAGFAQTYGITSDTVLGCESLTPEECWAQFATVNDFFIRQRVGLPTTRAAVCQEYRWATGRRRCPPDVERKIIVSPADNYCVLLDDVDIRRKVWIKGDAFSVERLFRTKTVSSSRLAVFRLAPHHYHRFHSPLTGTVRAMQFTGTEYLSVNPKLVRSSVDVLTRNVRLVLELETVSGETVYMAIIGASCVGSIQITHPKLLRGLGVTGPMFAKTLGRRKLVFDRPVRIQVNEELGNFQFGGSCIAMTVPDTATPTRVAEIIQTHTTKRAETELEVGQVLFTVR